MRNIIPNDSRYIPLVQQALCCVPTCILIIMLKHNIPLVPLELLGYKLGLVIPPKDKKLFWNMRASKKKPLDGGYGTQISKRQYHPNNVFPKLNIPLKMLYHSIEDYKDLSDYTKLLKLIVREDRDVLACFNYKKLYGKGNDGGHVSIIDRVYPRRQEVRLVDPVSTVAKWRVVKIKKLKKAMEVHAKDSSPGFWEFKKIN